MNTPLTRRFFLQSSGLLAAYVGVAPLLARSAGAAIAPMETTRGKTLVVIFLRGGADGLNLVVPFGDPHYAKLRPTLALAAAGPRAGEGVIDLDGHFGLHPRLAPLKPLFDRGEMIAAHAVGYDKNTRSHFEEQDVWETGIVGNTIGNDGWVNRHLETSTGHGRIRAVAIGDTLPRILRGKAPAYALRGVEDLSPPAPEGLAPDRVAQALQHAYCTPLPAERDAARELLAQAGGNTLEAIKDLREVSSTKYNPVRPYPRSGLAQRLLHVARLIKADIGLEVAEVDFGGWDTHQNQGNGAGGTFGNLAGELAEAVAAFMDDLAERREDVLLITLTDFGRTAAENGTGGTDHGWGNSLFVAGGAVKLAEKSRAAGTRVMGRWPGLAPDQLHEQRDLQHTTDFRDVLSEVVRVHLGNDNLGKVIPGHTPAKVGLIG
ncbi:MAG: DUF1501 domain-containing protein [Phycisphaerales bacterium]